MRGRKTCGRQSGGEEEETRFQEKKSGRGKSGGRSERHLRN